MLNDPLTIFCIIVLGFGFCNYICLLILYAWTITFYWIKTTHTSYTLSVLGLDLKELFHIPFLQSYGVDDGDLDLVSC